MDSNCGESKKFEVENEILKKTIGEIENKITEGLYL